MTLNVNPLTTADLTTAVPDGTGVFDTLMRAAKGHLEQEYSQNRMRGADYSQVYLGAMTAILQNSVAFLLQKDKASQDAALIEEQIKQAVLQQTLMEKQIEQAELQLVLMQKQIDQADKDAALKAAQTLKVTQETKNLVNQDLQTLSQTEVIKQQKLNLVSEGLQTVAQTDLIKQQKAQLVNQDLQTVAQTELIKQQRLNLVNEDLSTVAKTDLVKQQKLNLVSDGLQTVAQTALITQQKANLITENATMVKQQAKLDADTALVKQNSANAIIEGDNLTKQGCLLAAQYDLTMLNKLQTTAQTGLIQQKTSTEKAQITSNGVDADSVVGRQKNLYLAQTNGFTRDSEQKAAKILVDSWNVRRTTDDATVADGNNMLNDVTIGRFINTLAKGINA